MKTIVLLFAALLPLVAGQLASDKPRNSVRIFGRVIGPANAPIPNEPLTLTTTGRQESITIRTDRDGSFSFSVQPNQRYELLLAIPGFTRWAMGVPVNQKDVNLGFVAVQPPPPVRITGKLMGYTGALLHDKTVTLTANGREIGADQTDQNAAFEFPDLPANGKYALRIAIEGFSLTVLETDVQEANVDLGTIVIQPIRRTPPASVVLPDGAYISGQITRDTGPYMAGAALNFKKVILHAPTDLAAGTLELNPDGTFIFPAESLSEYELYVGHPPSYEGTAKVEVAGRKHVDVGNIVLHASAGNTVRSDLIGPVKLAGSARATRTTAERAIAAVVLNSSGAVHVLHDDGQEIQVAKENGQVGSSALLISENKQAAGWLVDSNFCCTSYPIQLMLVIYRPGKPLVWFKGDCRAIFDWHFFDGGRQVAFYQDFLHGTQAQHYELREIETGRLIGVWNGQITRKAPKWTRGLKS